MKAILPGLTEMNNFTFHFFIIKLCNDSGYHHIFKSSVFSHWLLCIKLKYYEHIGLKYERFQDPGKGNAIADSAITTTPIVYAQCSVNLCKK